MSACNPSEAYENLGVTGTCDGALEDLTGFSPVAVCLACEWNMDAVDHMQS
jgi:hypothetical protein